MVVIAIYLVITLALPLYAMLSKSFTTAAFDLENFEFHRVFDVLVYEICDKINKKLLFMSQVARLLMRMKRRAFTSW